MKTDIFISYRRKNYGSLAARAIYERLVNEGYQVFLDYTGIGGGKFWPQIEKNLREADDILVIFPGDCFSEEEDAAVFLKELCLALSLSNRIIPVFMKEFNHRAWIPEEVKPIMEMEGILFSDTSFDENIMRLRELLTSVPVHKPSRANTIEFFNEVTKNESLYAEKKDDYPEFIRKHLKTIMPLFRGIPYFTDERSVETTISAPEYYLAFPTDMLDSISFSKSRFSPVDVNLDQYIQRLMLSKKQKNAFMILLGKARYETAKEFIERRNGNLFNGVKYGIWSSDSNGRTSDTFEDPILHLDLYRTDYFTEKTMYRLFRLMCANDNWRSITSRSRDSLNNLSIFRNSLGVSLIVEIPSEQTILLTKRSGRAAFSGGKEWIYPSVTESVSETDFSPFSGLVELDLCVYRGILEELGIKKTYYDTDTIVYYSMFHETYFSQDGLTASVCLRNNVTTKQLLQLRGKDSELEVSNMIFLKLDPLEIKKFIMDNIDEIRPQALFTLLDYLTAKGVTIEWSE